jgi:hypothetical protein
MISVEIVVGVDDPSEQRPVASARKARGVGN